MISGKHHKINRSENNENAKINSIRAIDNYGADWI